MSLTSNGRIQEIRKEFPITKATFPIFGKKGKRPLIYLDHAASTHPSRPVLKAHSHFLERYYANIHRGNHNLSLIASGLFDKASEVITDFIGGNLEKDVVITATNTTQAINLAAHAAQKLEGITLCTVMEHHSNDLPHRRNGKVEYVDLAADGSLDMTDLENKLKAHKVKLLAITGASNVTGFLPDIHEAARLAHAHGAYILVDAAQLLAHHKIEVKPTGDPAHIDFLAAAGHKAYAPFGSAFLYGPRKLLDQADPFFPGGGTVVYVTHESTLYLPSPERHEGGTPNIPGMVALAESLKFLKEIGMEEIREHEQQLTRMALTGLQSIEGVTVYGPPEPERRLGVIAFNVLNLPHTLVSAVLNYEGGIATRNGCFCAHPYIRKLLHADDEEQFKAQVSDGEIPTLPGAVRASFGIYNTEGEVERFLKMVRTIRKKKWKGEYRFTKQNVCQPALFEPQNGE